MYYIGSMPFGVNYLQHHGVKGQVHGVRRYQNPDGSLTPEGRVHYGVGQRETSGHDIYEKQQIRRMNRAQRKIMTMNDKFNGKYNSRLDKRMQKAIKKYDEAENDLNVYENASEKERKRSRMNVRLKRAAYITAGVAATAAIVGAAAGITKINALNNKDMSIAKKYANERFFADAKSNYYFADRSKVKPIDFTIGEKGKGSVLTFAGERSKFGIAGNVKNMVNPSGSYIDTYKLSPQSILERRGYGKEYGTVLSDMHSKIGAHKNRIAGNVRKNAIIGGVGALGAAAAGYGASRNRPMTKTQEAEEAYYRSQASEPTRNTEGMRWGNRRYQNPDGSLTNEGKKKYKGRR